MRRRSRPSEPEPEELLSPLLGSTRHGKDATERGNNFTLPHTGIRKAMREDGWEI